MENTVPVNGARSKECQNLCKSMEIIIYSIPKAFLLDGLNTFGSSLFAILP